MFIVPFFSNCFSDVPKKVKTDFKAFPVEKKLNEVELLKITHLQPDNIDLYNDSVLCIVSCAGEKGYHFALYQLAQKTFLHPQLEFGRKDGQAMSFLSYGIEKKYLWSYDINKEKIIFSGLDSLRDTSSNHFLKEMPVRGFYYSVQLLNDTTLLTSGNYYSGDGYKISILDLNDGRIVRQLIPYSSNPSVPYTRPQKMAYESFLFVKPSKDKCVLACRYADRIEVVHLGSGKSKIVQGPDGFDPEMNVAMGNDHKELSIRGPDTRYAFVRGEVTNNFIYLLYSGNKDGTPHLFYGKYIYVYDWEGNPVQRLELNKDAEDFAVTSNDSLIYTYDPKSKYISVAKIKNQ
jgi:hypothetical protein